MTQHSSFNILIIDYPGACDLRARLIRSGAMVHVVSAPASIVLARQKRIDAAFVGFGADAKTVRLCEHLKGLGVSQIVVAPSDAGADRPRLSPVHRLPGSNGAISRVLDAHRPPVAD
jgi:hypothetical protein